MGLSLHRRHPLLEPIRVPWAPWSREDRVPFGPLLLPRARTGMLPNGPRNILPQRSVPAGHSPPTTEASVSVRVSHPRPESPVCLPSPSRLALSVHSVGSYRTYPEPGGIFPDQGSIENTLSPASSAGGFFTTGPPGREVLGLFFVSSFLLVNSVPYYIQIVLLFLKSVSF